MAKVFAGFVSALVVAALVGGVAVVAGLVPVDATDEPPRWEGAIAERALRASLARRVPERANPVPPTDSNVIAGMRTYRENCAGCHGGPSKRPEPFGESFYPRVPQFPIHPPRLPESQMFWVVKHGVRRTGMPGWGRLLRDDEIWRTVAFLARIDSLPPAVDSAWRTRGR